MINFFNNVLVNYLSCQIFSVFVATIDKKTLRNINKFQASWIQSSKNLLQTWYFILRGFLWRTHYSHQFILSLVTWRATVRCKRRHRNWLRLINTSQSRQKSFLVILYNYLDSELKRIYEELYYGLSSQGKDCRHPNIQLTICWKIILKWNSKQSMSLMFNV